MPAPAQLPYSTLSQQNPSYNCALIHELRDLYVGGYTIQANASRYLPKVVGEHDTRWKERVSQTAFIPYLGNVVDHFASAVFSQQLHVRGEPEPDAFYETFANDADLAASAFHEVCKSLLTTALIQGRGLLAVDFPPADEEIVTRLDEERSGTDRAYCFEVPVENLIDWEIESKVRKRVKLDGGSVEFDVGWFKWAIIHECRIERESPISARDTRVDSWKIWRRDDETGAIVWDVYELKRKLHSDGSLSEPNAGTKVPLVASGVTSFQRVPLVEMCLPDGLWVGNKIGPLVKEHFQRRSLINASENKSLGALAYVLLGPEVGALHGEVPAVVQQDPNRGDSLSDQLAAKGYLVLGEKDKIGYLEPEGTYAELADKRLSRLVDEIYRVAHLMAASVSSTANAVGRSGASKAEDRAATSIILSALGAIVHEFARRTYEVISEARGEAIEWVASGLDHYELTDRAELIDEATKVDKVAIPSPTFVSAYKADLAARLMPALSPEEREKIKSEIEKAVAESQKAAEVARKAAAAAPGSPPDEADEDDEQADEAGPPQPVAGASGEEA